MALPLIFCYNNIIIKDKSTVAVNWILTSDSVDKQAFYISNYVTQTSNESTAPIGTPKLYLRESTQVASGGYLVQADV